MSYLLIIRNAAGMSQSKMAAYLGVSKSLIYHVEKGLRELRSDVSLKALDLFIEIQKRNKVRLLPDTLRNVYDQMGSKLIKAAEDKNNIEKNIEYQTCRLERMKISDKKRTALQTTNQIMAENIRNGNFDEGDKSLLAVNKVDALRASRHCGPQRQNKIEASIRKLRAELLVIDGFIEENSPPPALPVMVWKEAV